jgi:hypothetical protein
MNNVDQVATPRRRRQTADDFIADEERIAAAGHAADGLDQSNPSSSTQIIRRAQEAWSRLAGDRTWEDWLAVGDALLLGRSEAMRDAHSNEPKGRRYENAFGTWLDRHGFSKVDKGDRHRLIECLTHRAEIEKWRATLTRTERLRLNHPSTVFRKWKAQVPGATKPKRPSIREAHAEALEKIDRLEKEIARGGGDLWTSDDRPRDIARVMVSKLSRDRAEKVARAILELLRNSQARRVGDHTEETLQ